MHAADRVAQYSYINLHDEISHVNMHVNEPYYEPAEWQANPHGERFDILDSRDPDALELTINQIAGHNDGNPGPIQSDQDILAYKNRDLHVKSNLQVPEGCSQGEDPPPTVQPSKRTPPRPL